MTGISCPVCSNGTTLHASGQVMGRHDAEYRRCETCGVVFVREPEWLEEAYSSPISDEDSGLLQRCAAMSRRTTRIIAGERIRGGRFLDWGGGYGVFTRLMRDAGYDYHHDDAYCTNLFARGFEDVPGTRYDLISAFEVLEHLTDPRADLAEIAARTDYLLCSTSIRPDPAPLPGEWVYYGPEHGQHVMFHTVDSLRMLGESLGFLLTTNGINLHLFHRAPLRPATRLMMSPRGRSVRLALHRVVAVGRS